MRHAREKTQDTKANRAAIIERIDAIARELSELRAMVNRDFTLEPSRSLTSELLGSLGSEPIEAYDHLLDWERFDSDEDPSRNS